MSTRVPLPYGPKVLELFRKPLNAGPMEDADVVATAGSPACGDMIKLYLKVDPRGEKIERVTFESYGCAANIAAASILTEKVAGRGLEEAWRISWREISNELGGLPPIKYHCSILAVGALKRAIRTYFERRAGSRPAWLPSELTQEEKQALEEEELMERLLRRSASAEGEKT
ncbi:MAG: iron-sulfur cluster assembly scaffold protein [Fervidicoccaceae archaeon]